MLIVTPILAEFKPLNWNDNYMFLLVDSETKEAAIVDPIEPEKAIAEAKRQGVNLTTILITHHHDDHTCGNVELIKLLNKDCKVYSGDKERTPGLTDLVKHLTEFQLGNLTIRSLHTPCHTTTHICYYIQDETNKSYVFTGDTLFIGGCGRFFEGTAEQMYDSLINVLSKLPDNTFVYCAHEYTVSNLKFAKSIDGKNKELDAKLVWAESERKLNHFTIPSTIGDEKMYNPFMRVNNPDILAHCQTKNPIEAMKILRQQKDDFSPHTQIL